MPYNYIDQDMKSAILLLTLALTSVAFAGILSGTYHTPNPNDIWKHINFAPLRTLDYAEPEVEVAVAHVTYGYHGQAYNKIKLLFPRYAVMPVWRCRYSALGQTRFYIFTFKVDGRSKQVNAAVETAEEESAASKSEDEKQGFMRVSVVWAQEDPRISSALGYVLKENWSLIGGRPLIFCYSKPVAGQYIYRFYFKNVNGKFQYKESSAKKAPKTLKEGSKSYFTEVAPILALTKSDNPQAYTEYLIEELKGHPAFPKIKELFEKELGFFDDNWIVKYAGVGGKQGNAMKLIINFKPFLLQQHYEAFYYGDVEKASLLKLDEVAFNAGNSYEKWQEIEEFSKFNAFKEAHEYVLSQFSWLRFYEVVGAYAALHKKGRFIRFVYQGIAENNIDNGQQINIIAYLDEMGCYFIDRNDFHATHLNSYGRNEWVSLFVDTPEVTQAKYYQRIVKFHKDIYPKFWFANQLEDIKFKGDLHVIKFKNPTNLKYLVLLINEKETKVLNKVNWTKLSEDSPLIGRIENYVRGKYADCGSIMFIQFFKNEKGTHFEVSFLTKKRKQYRSVYILYIADTDVFTDNKWYSYKALAYGKHPLPKDVKASILEYLAAKDESIIAVSAFVSLSPNSFAIIGITESGRWQITVEWQEGEWVVVSKQPYKDGYYKAMGYPSAAVSAASGFLKKFYPKQFGEGYVYASIETKSVGVAIYMRFVYKFKGLTIEAVVKKVYGVRSSHVLHSWKVINGLNEKKDYGYGSDYTYSYNVPKELLYQDSEPVKTEAAPKPARKQTKAGRCPPGSRKSLFGMGCIILF